MFFIALLSTSDSHAESTDISSITQTVRRLILMAFRIRVRLFFAGTNRGIIISTASNNFPVAIFKNKKINVFSTFYFIVLAMCQLFYAQLVGY